MMDVMYIVWISTFLYHWYALGKLYNVVVAFHGYQYKILDRNGCLQLIDTMCVD